MLHCAGSGASAGPTLRAESKGNKGTSSAVVSRVLTPSQNAALERAFRILDNLGSGSLQWGAVKEVTRCPVLSLLCLRAMLALTQRCASQVLRTVGVRVDEDSELAHYMQVCCAAELRTVCVVYSSSHTRLLRPVIAVGWR